MTKNRIYFIGYRGTKDSNGKKLYKLGITNKFSRRSQELKKEFKNLNKGYFRVKVTKRYARARAMERILHRMLGPMGVPVVKRNGALSSECYRLSYDERLKVVEMLNGINKHYRNYMSQKC